MDLSAACGGNHGGADTHTVAHVGLHTGVGRLFLEGTVAHGETMLDQVYPEVL